MPSAKEYFDSWVSVFHPGSDEAPRLVCLPHAGGSASFFFPVSRALAPAVEVLAIQYPGRQTRHHEPGIETIGEFADHVFAVLRDLDDRPLAFFGHSMGAIIAYEVALRMRDSGRPAPMRLFASGRRAPSRYRDERIHTGTDAEVTAELRTLGGPHADLLADPEVLAMFLGAIRTDYRAVERYRHDPDRLLDCPITVLTGDADPRVSTDEARDWARHTTGPTDVEVFTGGHFYLIDHAARVIDLLARRLDTRGLDEAPGIDLHSLSR